MHPSSDAQEQSNTQSSPAPSAANSAASTTEAAVGFGSNLGNKLSYLTASMRMILELPGVELVAKSHVYETEPVDVPPEFANISFVNAVAIFSVPAAMSVEEWSSRLHSIEGDLMRTRSRVPNTPRTIDLDLLYFGDTVSDKPHLCLPHPQIASRRFVCQPLSDLRPDLILPGQTKSVARLLAALPIKPTVSVLTEAW